MEDEIREERLDSPLVVHKKDDASYQESAVSVDMNATHSDDGDMPTLERHRFRKVKKNHNGVSAIVAVLAVAVAIAAAMVYSGKISFKEKETTTQPDHTYVTEAVNEFKSVITIKGTYIFYEGAEVDGLEGLESEIKYLDAGTKFTIQDEDANSDFLNFDVLSLLSKYNIDYEITHIVSSGLMSVYEQTTAPITEPTTTQPSTEPVSDDNAQ